MEQVTPILNEPNNVEEELRINTILRILNETRQPTHPRRLLQPTAQSEATIH